MSYSVIRSKIVTHLSEEGLTLEGLTFLKLKSRSKSIDSQYFLERVLYGLEKRLV